MLYSVIYIYISPQLSPQNKDMLSSPVRVLFESHSFASKFKQGVFYSIIGKRFENPMNMELDTFAYVSINLSRLLVVSSLFRYASALLCNM